MVGEPKSEALTRLLAGEDPATVEDEVPGAVVASKKRSVLGFEWSWSPPKSVSVLWALADPETRAVIETVMDAATVAALGQVDEFGSVTRRRVGGRQVREPSEGLVGVMVPHTSSRDGDPQIHRHVVVANQVRRLSDKKWCTPDARGLYGSLAWASTVWGYTLRAGLTEALGVVWEPVVDGLPPEIVGIPAELCGDWSKRAKAIAAKLEGWDNPGALGSGKHAARFTRRDKDLSETRAEKFARWQAEALEVGFAAADVAADVAAAAGRDVEAPKKMGQKKLAEKVAASIDERLTTWDRVEWLTTAAEVGGERVTVEDILSAAAAELDDKPRLVAPLPDDGPRLVVPLPDDPDGSCLGGRWTTQANLDREEWVIDKAVDMSQRQRTLVDAAVVLDHCGEAGLDTEQTQAVMDILLSGRRFHTVAAPAGTGKTTTMGVLAAVLGRYRTEVRALAVSQDATNTVADAMGVRGTGRDQNIARFLGGDDPGRGEWWMIDEASMVDTHQWKALLQRAERVGATVVAAGDPAQLGSVGPGGLYRAMVDHPDLPTVELEQVWRMNAEWEKAASLRLRALENRRGR